MSKRNNQSAGKQISTQHVADIVGLARSTVVRALRNDPKLKAETIERVQLVARQLGYKHNHIARSLALGRTNIVGCVIPNVVNPFFADMITEITTHLASKEFSVLLGVTNDSEEIESKYLQTFMSYRVEGILVAAPPQERAADRYLELKDYERPVVMIGEGEPIGIDSVRSDDESGAFDMMCFLKRCGYSRVAFMGDLEVEGNRKWAGRLDGYRRGLLENNLSYDPGYLVNCPNIADIGGCLDRLLDRPAPPEVIFAGNDRLAIEVIHVLQKRGLDVPDDLAVVGFDNIRASAEMSPQVTTVDLHIVQTVRIAVGRLLERVDAFHAQTELEDAGRYHVRIKPELRVRETTRMRAPAPV
ncbi:MAG TPA: LacI family DNA-binding transcriptional regulator [Candidatus Sumerlaeota bacterium]|nr:MAG: Catabolite control protein A [candidate division BRC1 bacterium ADurb.BinA292]HOE95345.1 LacI family DNA-binding transcriptional regulator [Candidatus Sumerlaeota bacterium]HOR26788.1 LacI family DNA-binding transcriptional regulator [Candidatus Sumerlaeota bacterium]HPK01300.1 LacI family DNA-binding transcriptional regulator [Candidatus Sumerlaeota bacterium]